MNTLKIAIPKKKFLEIQIINQMKFRFTKDLIYLIIISVLLATGAQLYYTKNFENSQPTTPKVYYNKETKLNEKIIELIQDSNEYVYFSIYTFTRYDIKDALLGAKHRGIKIVGITDKNQVKDIPNQEKIVAQLKEAGIPVYLQDHSYIMHMKVLITEKAYASGSFNWTANATDKNDEVLEIGTDPKVIKQYKEIIETLIDKYK